MADFKKNLEKLARDAKLYWRGFRASVKTYGKYAFWAVAFRVALFVFFRKK